MPLRNINSKWVKDLDIRLETTELLEENIRKKLLITCLGNDFIDMKPKAPKKKKKRPSERDIGISFLNQNLLGIFSANLVFPNVNTAPESANK